MFHHLNIFLEKLLAGRDTRARNFENLCPKAGPDSGFCCRASPARRLSLVEGI